MDEKERTDFGQYMKRMREEAGLSLREAERKIGISNSYLYQIERGERGAPKLEILRNMSIAYGVPYKAILTAAHLDEPSEVDQYFVEDELERAFEFVSKDKRFRFGTQMNGDELTPEAKRFIVEVYQRLAGRQLLGGGDEADDNEEEPGSEERRED